MPHTSNAFLEGLAVPAKSNTNNPLLLQVKQQPWRTGVRWLGLNSAAGSCGSRKAEKQPLLAGGSGGRQVQGAVYALPVPGAWGRGVRAGTGSKGTLSQGMGVFHGEGTCEWHLRGVYQPCQGSSS